MSSARLAIQPRLTSLFFGLMVLIFAGALVVLSGVVRHHITHMEDDVQAFGVMRSGQSLQINFTEAMMREWSSVKAVAGTLDTENPMAVTPRLKALSRIDGHILWAGYVDGMGKVRASSMDELVGEDVSDGLFYRRGLTGGYIGAPKDGPLFEAMGRSFPGEHHYVDMAFPVHNELGRVAGVLVYRLGTGWIERVLKASAGALAIDALLVNEDGDVLINATQETEATLSSQEVGAIRSGRVEPTKVDRIDGSPAFVSVMPPLLQGPFSALDWKIVTRAEGLPQGITAFSRNLIAIVISFVIGLWIVITIFARMFLEPIERIAQDASRIATDGTIYPHEENGSYTSYQLSSAMALIQGKLKGSEVGD